MYRVEGREEVDEKQVEQRNKREKSSLGGERSRKRKEREAERKEEKWNEMNDKLTESCDTF